MRQPRAKKTKARNPDGMAQHAMGCLTPVIPFGPAFDNERAHKTRPGA